MKRLLKVTAMTSMLTLLRMVMGFVIAKFIAVYTGPSGLAMLGQIQSMVVSLNGLINAPAGSGVVRYTSENYRDGYQACAPWWRASIQWILIVSAIVIPIGFVFSEYLSNQLFQDPSFNWLIVITVCLLPLAALGTICNSVINGQQQYRRYVSLGMVSVVVSSCLMVLLIITANIEGALFATAIQSGLIGLIMLLLNFKQPWFKFQYWWGKTDLITRKSIGGYMLMAITSALTVPVSLILVRNMVIDQLGWEAAGYWQAVWRISDVYITVITMALSTYYLPKLSSLVGVECILKEVRKTVSVIIPIVIVLSLIVYFLRDFAIAILFTEEFSAARDLFAIQLTANVIKITGWLYAYPMLSRGATKWYISSEIFFSISIVLLSYLFITGFGLKGIVFASLLNNSIYLFFVMSNIRTFSR
ncbi:LPS biosynthesis protein [Shewanella inventionis]|uniref:LPS biosynthesis protein n=2 Tax=Shewanella inventionis TaxID=1738770 RepID=A0ABQ1J5G1_9GAMM|nr:O-antigen translocase [Shewanella inventionis]GGB60507.1 LPS biosynthesis protein [Shewanella inventionis]